MSMLKGKTALVTGSTSGIGLGIAKALAAEGANIVMNGFGEKDAAIAEVKALGVEVEYHGADMSRASEIEDMMNFAAKRFGAVDILVNNAGIQHVANIEDFPVDLVFGHFGYSHAKHGINDKGFQGLLELLKNERAWVKMTGPYRICDGNLPYSDMRPMNDAVTNANPKRLIWGSDWPHVMVKKQMPHDADLCDLLGDWVSDPNLRKSILVDNPCMLYDFPALKH